jgi:hypothetical protein
VHWYLGWPFYYRYNEPLRYRIWRKNVANKLFASKRESPFIDYRQLFGNRKAGLFFQKNNPLVNNSGLLHRGEVRRILNRKELNV